VVDRLLRLLGSRAWRRGVAGEPVWLAVAGALWLVRRGRRANDEVVWSGRVGPGQRVVVAVTDPRAARADGGE
jgi:hypothetical protein